MSLLHWFSVALALMLFGNADAATIEIHRETLVRDSATIVRVLPDSVDVLVHEFFSDAAGSGASETVRQPGDAGGWTVVVEYFPNSKVMRDDTVGVTDARGVVTWTPVFAGIVFVKAVRGNEVITKNLSVRYPAVPAGAVLVFFVAGTILLGGAAWSLIHLMEHKPPDGKGNEGEGEGEES